ncbi:MAG: ABC transporter permease [Candidatus Lokiarchaeota archaeon]|nr:ABC transporter permease [Candidatus Lokiarchaeota archaeon]
MEEPYLVVGKEELEEIKEPIPKKIVSWFFKNLKFLFLPGSRIEELTIRELEYEKSVSRRSFMRRLKNPLTILGFCIVFFVATLAVFAPWLSPQSYIETLDIHAGSWNPPSPEHPLGQTWIGGDVLSRIIWGARTSLTIAIPSITISVTGGVVLGVISAYYGGWVDSLIMRMCDILLAFPSLVLSLVLIAIYGRNIQIILMVWGILGIPVYARLIRGNVLQARELPYIQAARVAGAGDWRIMFRHILPNVIQPIIVFFTFDIGSYILGLAGLSFLGVHSTIIPEWGSDINKARANPYGAPWASLWPGFMILFTVLGFMLVGDGLRDALDPKLKNL